MYINKIYFRLKIVRGSSWLNEAISEKNYSTLVHWGWSCKCRCITVYTSLFKRLSTINKTRSEESQADKLACVALAKYSGSCSNVFIEPIFFFMVSFLKKMGIIISASDPHCHSRLSKPILKILSIYRKNILRKQLSEAICSKCIFRLLHAPKFHAFYTKLNMMVKVVKLFTGVLWKSCSDEFYRKISMRKSLF